MKTEGVQLVECRMSEHEGFPLNGSSRTTQIGVIEKRGGTAFLGRGVVRLARREGQPTPLQLRTPSSRARAETASTRAASMPR